MNEDSAGSVRDRESLGQIGVKAARVLNGPFLFEERTQLGRFQLRHFHFSLPKEPST
jgi:hypothetical protein